MSKDKKCQADANKGTVKDCGNKAKYFVKERTGRLYLCETPAKVYRKRGRLVYEIGEF